MILFHIILVVVVLAAAALIDSVEFYRKEKEQKEK